MHQKTSPQHYFMTAILLTYVPYVRDKKDEDGTTAKQRHMNIVLELPRKALTSSALNQARAGALHRLQNENGVENSEVRDMVFLGFSYLGNLKPEDFYDIPDGQPH